MWQGSVFMLCAKDEAIWPDATPWHEREKGHGVAVGGGGGGFGVWRHLLVFNVDSGRSTRSAQPHVAGRCTCGQWPRHLGQAGRRRAIEHGSTMAEWQVLWRELQRGTCAGRRRQHQRHFSAQAPAVYGRILTDCASIWWGRLSSRRLICSEHAELKHLDCLPFPTATDTALWQET